MTLDNRLLFGIVLICFGLALAALAYIVFTSRNSEDENEEGTEEGGVPESQMPEPETIKIKADETSIKKGAKPDRPPTMEPEATLRQPTSQPEPRSIEPEPHQDTPSPTPAKLSPKPEPHIEGQRRVTIATLLREEVTGELVVQVGDREYLNVSDLVSSVDMTRVEYAAADLAKWFSKTPHEQPAPELKEEPVVEKPQGMIEQINAILKEKLTDPTGSSAAVRLIEDPGGAIRVLVGVNSYNLDDVPDDEVKALIREAVNAWEESQ